MKFFLNLAILGKRPTGLGVYAKSFAEVVSRRFSCKVLCNKDIDYPGEKVESPTSIVLGAGRAAAIKRYFFLRSVKLSADELAISPTHHGLKNAKNQIITVHDLIALRFPAQLPLQWAYFKYVLPGLARRCLAVFTVSETSAEDIVDRLKVDRRRVFVVPNVIDFDKTQLVLKKRLPVLLCVGARFSHKNIHELLDMHDLWVVKYRLEIVSATGKYGDFLRAKIKTFGLEKAVTIRGYVEKQELDRLYQTCEALVYPSHWEGFGIPALEALANGMKVIVSDIPVHREVCGAAAIYVKLGSRSSWSEAFETLQENSPDFFDIAEKVLMKYTKKKFEESLVLALNSAAELSNS